ncbi:hypothetical protein D9Q98_002440 [Chlorella vulgaris]|uniref:Uncharacterized protein n=1 Tax=Chlorella vulgaris TaxID=3077 RepID=A0A9D4TWM8_CHLVU|nr:hypothetical protein D9Q98_002440 [Chlorella vulgaris]
MQALRDHADYPPSSSNANLAIAARVAEALRFLGHLTPDLATSFQLLAAQQDLPPPPPPPPPPPVMPVLQHEVVQGRVSCAAAVPCAVPI